MEEHDAAALWPGSCWYIGQGAAQPVVLAPDGGPGRLSKPAIQTAITPNTRHVISATPRRASPT
jgi:hypothetical protein